MLDKIKCRLGFHEPGNWTAAPGARDVKRCRRCGVTVEERPFVVANMPSVPRPKGSHTDKWLK